MSPLHFLNMILMAPYTLYGIGILWVPLTLYGSGILWSPTCIYGPPTCEVFHILYDSYGPLIPHME